MDDACCLPGGAGASSAAFFGPCLVFLPLGAAVLPCNKWATQKYRKDPPLARCSKVPTSQLHLSHGATVLVLGTSNLARLVPKGSLNFSCLHGMHFEFHTACRVECAWIGLALVQDGGG